VAIGTVAPVKLLHLVGTRPNFMKIAPVMRALSVRAGVNQVLVHTGQHYDRGLSDVFFEDLDMPYPDHFLGIGSGTHAEQTARVMLALEPVLEQHEPDAVVVPGDVNSTLAGALTAVKLGIPVVHLEAGLRSRDWTMPEEHNRVLTDHVSALLLTPTRDADQNLLREGIPPERIELVGNTMIDSLRQHQDAARALDVARAEYGVDNHLLVTLHRPALVDDPAALMETMDVLEEVADERPVLFPVHPRTASVLSRVGWEPRRVLLLPPQGYLRFLSLLASSAMVLTDSGGVQEEATVLGVPCFTLRTVTERPITVSQGTNTVLGLGTPALEAFRAAASQQSPRLPCEPEGWDGRAATRSAAVLVRMLAEGVPERPSALQPGMAEP
jgi:UDP-N-acetylglucosamine 2-epimerase (non-hydrolysing)